MYIEQWRNPERPRFKIQAYLIKLYPFYCKIDQAHFGRFNISFIFYVKPTAQK